jgi:hypothetical protein
MTRLRNGFAAVLAMVLGAGATLSPASAGGGYQPPDDAVYSFLVASGGDISKSAGEGYLGLYFALNRDLDRDGFIVRLLGTRGLYDYTDNDIGFDGKYWQGDAMLGYQWVRGGIDFAVYLGVDYQDYKISPNDPASKLIGDEVGFKVAVDLESNGRTNSPYYYNLTGSYSTAFDTYYALGRVGYTFGRFTIGPEAWVLGDLTGDAQRIGGFLKFDVSLGGATSGSIALSGGYQFVDDHNGSGPNSKFGEEGAYGTLQFQMAFGREERIPLK